jgi:DNA-binding XRE family transcriptional regulator
MFTFEGKNIPDYVVLYFQSAFPDVEVVDADEEPVEIIKSDWFKEIESKTTPAESLKLLRTTFGYTQQQLADKVGITKQQISAMERGREPIGRKMAHRLANALGTSYKNLFW